MIECLLTRDGGIIETVDAPCPGCWVNVANPTKSEQDWLVEEIGILPEFVQLSLDDEESSHIDHDEDTRQTLIIFNYPVVDESGTGTRASVPLQYDTMPLSIVIVPEKTCSLPSLSSRTRWFKPLKQDGFARSIHTCALAFCFSCCSTSASFTYRICAASTGSQPKPKPSSMHPLETKSSYKCSTWKNRWYISRLRLNRMR